ncbi:MAG TPA: HAD-IIIA family hydrolase [Patescibacteria group bacterium]|nr:HAD-IIIA family hydrolase [Patescibacteria group bacterium]
MHSKRRAIFLDRDGVLNDLIDRGENFEVHGKKVRWTAPFSFEEFRLRPDIIEPLNAFQELGFLRVLVTNQPDMAYGLLPQEEYDRIMQAIACLPLDDIFVCPHRRDDDCVCKKPKPGMLFQAAEKWGIELTESYMIGDRMSDMEAGAAARCQSILIGNSEESGKTSFSIRRAKDLREALTMIQQDLQNHL